MDSYLCNDYSWISSLEMSDSTYWESVFPCKKEFEPAPKKQRLNIEDENINISSSVCKIDIPEYFDLTTSRTEHVEKNICTSFFNIVDNNPNENESGKHQDISPTWDDFCKYMECQETDLFKDNSTSQSPMTTTKERRKDGNRASSNMVVIGDKVRYSCSLCTKTFPTSRGQKLHLHSHRTHKKNIQSSSRSSRPQVELKQEYNHQRIENKPFKCPLCERGFNIRQDLYVHIVSGACTRADRFLRRVTNGWECNSCDKLFDSRNKAECHTRTHTYGSSITCPVCSKDFTGCKGNIVVKHVKERHPGYFDELGC